MQQLKQTILGNTFCFAIHICEIHHFIQDVASLCVALASWMPYVVCPGHSACMAWLFLAATWLRCCEWHGWFQGISNAVLLFSRWNVFSTVTPENFEVPSALSLNVSAVELPSQSYNGFVCTLYLSTRLSCTLVPQYVTSSWGAGSFLPPTCLCVLGEWLQCCFTASELGWVAAAVTIMEITIFLSNSTWFVSITYSNKAP